MPVANLKASAIKLWRLNHVVCGTVKVGVSLGLWSPIGRNDVKIYLSTSYRHIQVMILSQIHLFTNAPVLYIPNSNNISLLTCNKARLSSLNSHGTSLWMRRQEIVWLRGKTSTNWKGLQHVDCIFFEIVSYRISSLLLCVSISYLLLSAGPLASSLTRRS